MTGKGEVLNPGKVEIAMTFTMTLDEWESIAAQMGSRYPEWKFADAIGDMTRTVRKSVYFREKGE